MVEQKNVSANLQQMEESQSQTLDQIKENSGGKPWSALFTGENAENSETDKYPHENIVKTVSSQPIQRFGLVGLLGVNASTTVRVISRR